MQRFKSFIIEARRNASNPAQQRLNAIEKLAKYKDDPKVHISYTSINKIGINPKSNFPDTPLAVFAYPLKQVWKDIESEGIGNVPFAAANAKYVFILREKSGMIDVKKYTNSQLDKDIKKISSDIPNEMSDEIHAIIKKSYKQTQKSTKRPYKFLNIFLYQLAIKKKIFKASAFISKKMIDLGYSGFSDKGGDGLIHSAEPIQSFFLTSKSYDVIEVIDITTLDMKDMTGRELSKYLTKNGSVMTDEEILTAIEDDITLLKYTGKARTEVLKKVITMEKKEKWKSKQPRPDADYDGDNYVAAEKSLDGKNILFYFKTLPEDFIEWSLKNGFQHIHFWAKRNNYKFSEKQLNYGMILDPYNTISSYDTVSLNTAKLYWKYSKDIGTLAQKMNEKEFLKFASTIKYELPMTYYSPIAKDLYDKLMSKSNPTEDDIFDVSAYIQKTGAMSRSEGKEVIPMDMINSLKSKFTDFDFTMVGNWDFWKKE